VLKWAGGVLAGASWFIKGDDEEVMMSLA
jgi:hypothetical protein